MTVEYMGNKALLEREMVAFLAPSRVSPVAVLPTLDWATLQVREHHVVVSGFSSRMEREVWNVLMRGGASIVKVVVGNRYKVVPSKYRTLLDSGRLLIVFLGIGKRLSRQNAPRRNSYVANIADSAVFPYIDTESSLFPLFLLLHNSGKPVKVLNDLLLARTIKTDSLLQL